MTQKEWTKTFTAKNGEKLVFRPEQPTDTDMLWTMFSTLSQESTSNLIPPFTRERIESWTHNINYNEVLAIVAVTAEKTKQQIVATSSLRFNPQEVFNHKAELGITVHDSYQNIGIGTALLNHMIEIAKTKKLTKVHLIVNTDNHKAVSLYRKAGFEIEGELRREIRVDGKYRDEYRMAICLQ